MRKKKSVTVDVFNRFVQEAKRDGHDVRVVPVEGGIMFFAGQRSLRALFPRRSKPGSPVERLRLLVRKMPLEGMRVEFETPPREVPSHAQEDAAADPNVTPRAGERPSLDVDHELSQVQGDLVFASSKLRAFGALFVGLRNHPDGGLGDKLCGFSEVLDEMADQFEAMSSKVQRVSWEIPRAASVQEAGQ